MPNTAVICPDDPGIHFTPSADASAASLLTSGALQFVAELERRFGSRRQQLLGLREDRQQRLNEGEQPGFRIETAELRDAQWQAKTAPADLRERHVELLVPAGRTSLEQAFASGASTVIADLEDSHAPTWQRTLAGQHALKELIGSRRRAGLAVSGSAPRPTLMLRPRGWHLLEHNLRIDDRPVSASLFDFALYLYHNAHNLREQGSGPYFCLPKLESYVEAQLWADLFACAEESLGLSHGRISCSVLIETLPAVFEMEEILFTLRDYAVGLNFGRQDHLFSFIKRFQAIPERVLPETGQFSGAGFQHACSRLLVQTCHRRGAHAIGCLSTQIPDRPGDDLENTLRQQKTGEAEAGFDGTWVAHSGLVRAAREAFESVLSAPHQFDRQLDDLRITESDLLCVPEGRITAHGIDLHVRTGLHYLSSWLDGEASVAIDNRLRDIADAEIARAQLWQWVHHPGGRLDDNSPVTYEMVDSILQQALQEIRLEIGEAAYQAQHYPAAAELLGGVIASDRFEEFLTQPAGHRLA
ncbi:MAG: malate synthase [Sedimenticola sp.]|nr:malate synthase [Sedimenticola sp.]